MAMHSDCQGQQLQPWVFFDDCIIVGQPGRYLGDMLLCFLLW